MGFSGKGKKEGKEHIAEGFRGNKIAYKFTKDSAWGKIALIANRAEFLPKFSVYTEASHDFSLVDHSFTS